ncbi:MAG: hypothetical protein ABSC48_00055 [Terracidiphilus sp.]|jgi:hypothetical protein
MTIYNDELERMVVEAVADDYEEFATIVQCIARCMSKVHDAPDENEIEQSLMKSIADSDVIAYEESEELHRLIATEANPQNIRTLWFYITKQGKERLRRLEEEEIKSGTYMADWEPDPNGGWRKSGQ